MVIVIPTLLINLQLQWIRMNDMWNVFEFICVYVCMCIYVYITGSVEAWSHVVFLTRFSFRKVAPETITLPILSIPLEWDDPSWSYPWDEWGSTTTWINKSCFVFFITLNKANFKQWCNVILRGSMFRRIYLNCNVHLLAAPVPESVYFYIYMHTCLNICIYMHTYWEYMFWRCHLSKSR